jgi:WD40 repeat protein
MSVDFDPRTHELIVFTREDMRVYDIKTGRVKHLFAGFLDGGEEPTSYKYIYNGKLFAVGTHRGDIRLYSKETGMHVDTLHGHDSDVSELIYDSINMMFISAGWDSNIMIQRQTKSNRPCKYEKVRTIRDNFGRK